MECNQNEAENAASKLHRAEQIKFIIDNIGEAEQIILDIIESLLR